MTVQSGRNGRVEWGVASSPLPGELHSGDVFVVREHGRGVLVGVVDGLGHGSEAAIAAERAVSILARHAGESVLSLTRRCHEGLMQTRGVVMSLASFHYLDDTLTWIGIGNVEGVLAHGGSDVPQRHIHIVQRGGVVGYQLPPLQAAVVPISQGDTVILATDGIRPEFYDELNIRDTPAGIARFIGERFRRETDDSLVLVVRYL